MGLLLQGSAHQLRSARSESVFFLILILALKLILEAFRIVFHHLLIRKMLGRGRLQLLLLFGKIIVTIITLVIAVIRRYRLSRNQKLL